MASLAKSVLGLRLSRRYANFFFVGVAVEASRLLSFWMLAKVVSPALANLVSLPINVLVAFLLFGGITWRDRSGNWLGKLFRFSVGKWFVLAVKGGLFPLWRAVPVLACPFYDWTHDLVDALARRLPLVVGLNELFTCDWMSLALMDLTLALTLGFLVNDRFSFWRRFPEK